MTEITISLIKKIRELTGAGIMKCKKALIETDGNVELAIENIRKSFNDIIVSKKSSQIITEGLTKTKIRGNCGSIVEVNCQTDFVAKNKEFHKFINEVADVALSQEITDINVLKREFEEDRVALIGKMGENIDIRRVACIKGNVVDDYLHIGGRIGVLIAASTENKELIKKIAMHIAANQPKFIKSEDIPTKMIEQEYQAQLDIVMQFAKSKKTAEKIVVDKIKQFINAICLINQVFIFNENQTVGQCLIENSIEITDFIRFEVGENA